MARTARGAGQGHRVVHGARWAQMIATLPSELRTSITWTRGSETAQHATFALGTDVPTCAA